MKKRIISFLNMVFNREYSDHKIIKLKEDLKFYELCLKISLSEDRPARTIGYFAKKAQKIRRKLNMPTAWYET